MNGYRLVTFNILGGGISNTSGLPIRIMQLTPAVFTHGPPNIAPILFRYYWARYPNITQICHKYNLGNGFRGTGWGGGAG